jgi:nucleoid-associated protein YgaU
MDNKSKSAKPAAAPDFSQYHVVVSGDTLGKIAKKYYGDSSLYMTIFDANKDQLKDPNKINVGQKLRIP